MRGGNGLMSLIPLLTTGGSDVAWYIPVVTFIDLEFEFCSGEIKRVK